MKIWLPYVIGGSGTDTFTRSLVEVLERHGHDPVPQAFPHATQYAPDLLSLVRPPPRVDGVLTNSWNGFAFKRSGIPMVAMVQLCVHDSALDPFRSRQQAVFHHTFVRRFERRSFRAADMVIAVSDYTKRAVNAAFPDVEPLVIRNGIDTDFFHPPIDRRTSPHTDPFRLLFVGNLTTRKGADLLPSIMGALGADYELRYTSGLREKGVLPGANAHSLGTLDRSGVREAYHWADALLFPTRLEGLSLTVMEAMACGLPVVTSRATSMPEIIEDGMNGRLCAVENPSSYVDAIRELRSTPLALAEMRRAARAVAVDQFSMTRVASEYVALFSQLINGRID